MATAAEVLKEAEDRVSRFLNGVESEGCSVSIHQPIPPASRLARLVMLKMLRSEMPHQSTQIPAIEAEIAKELKK